VPELEVYELSTVEPQLASLGGPEKRDSTVEDEIIGLRVAALHEAVILIHKAGNVLRAAAEEGERGYRTWCRSSAYHAAFFAMRGVLGVLGVMVFRGRDRQSEYQVDLWAPRQKKTKAGPTESRFAIRIIRRKQRAEHKELWAIFSRVLRVTKIDRKVWPLLPNDPLKDLDPGQFSRIRHQLHYRSAGWLFADLDNLKTTDDFSKLAEDAATMKHLDTPEDQSFPLALGMHVLSLGVALLTDLGKKIPRVDAEAKRAQKWMSASPWKQANAFALIN
jgi:hypothetical protein